MKYIFPFRLDCYDCFDGTRHFCHTAWLGYPRNRVTLVEKITESKKQISTTKGKKLCR
jgi:hypothetical protein